MFATERPGEKSKNNRAVPPWNPFPCLEKGSTGAFTCWGYLLEVLDWILWYSKFRRCSHLGSLPSWDIPNSQTSLKFISFLFSSLSSLFLYFLPFISFRYLKDCVRYLNNSLPLGGLYYASSEAELCRILRLHQSLDTEQRFDQHGICDEFDMQ